VSLMPLSVASFEEESATIEVDGNQPGVGFERVSDYADPFIAKGAALWVNEETRDKLWSQTY
jgi:hypothetical protein